MESPILKQIVEFLQTRKQQKRWMVAFIFMAAIVGLGTVTALRMMGQAMTRKEHVLDCQLKLHEHTEECYDDNGNQICGYADYVVHKHNDDCYDSDGKLICRLPEIEKHEHTEECYEEKKTLVCGQEESEGHVHTAECYTSQKGGLQCGKEEHSHTDGCYDEQGNLICGMEEHQHSDDCYQYENVLTCSLQEGEGAHKHTDECYDVQKVLTCSKLELHTHTDECFEKIDKDGEDVPENLRLVCGKTELLEHTHTEEAGCLRTVDAAEADVMQAEIDKEAEEAEKAGGEASEEGKEVFTTELNEEEENGEDAGNAEDEEAADAEGEAAENEEAAGAEGEAAEDEESEAADEAAPETYEESKTYEGLGYIVTASYNKDANIPEEAKFVAEQITKESDEEDYKKHEEEYKKSVGNENATMSALFKIGFYVDGEEVEPAASVAITVQFVDKNGLPEGAPINVVHFGDEKTEVIKGSKAESGSTSFKTKSFSKFAVGYEEGADVKNASVHISESYEYTESPAFQIIFHVEGDAKILKGERDEETDIGSVETLASEVEGKTSVPEEEEATEEAVTEEETTEEAATKEETTEEAESSLKDELRFELKHFDKESEEYKAVIEDAATVKDGSELLFTQVFSYSMYYGDDELDLSECEVTAEMKPTETLSSHIKQSVPKAVAYLREEGDVSEESKSESQAEDGATEDEFQTEIRMEAVEIVDGNAVKSLNAEVLDSNNTSTSMAFKAPRVFAAKGTGTPNPHFEVQYYANLKVMAYNQENLKENVGIKWGVMRTNELPLINTSGKKLPLNGKGDADSPNGNAIRTIYVDPKTGKLKTKDELTKVYETRSFEYHKAPSLNYINALVENNNYDLKEVWILQPGKSADSTKREDWTIKAYSKDLHFTNRELPDNTPNKDNYVYIAENTTIRLVYDPADEDKDFDAAFYDYDIGDGNIYKNKNDADGQKNGKKTSQQGTETWYMHTKQSGINSPGNYTGKSGAKFAFGNANTGSGLQHEKWSGNLLNKHNSTQPGHPTVIGSYKGCTFGLAEKLVDGKIQYASGVAVPNLFNDGDAAGKKAYDDYSLKFNRVGDTHTLIAVNNNNGIAANNLASFNNPFPVSGITHYHIWTNNFWPMDSASSYGTDGHDMKFGNYTNKSAGKYKFAGQAGAEGGNAGASGDFPESDDGKDHNSYFGMHYKVKFDLTADYAGPLEYYFFGDDDMWVFLSEGDTGDGKLICDIGGVHSSVGEYVNLWDYIDKETEKIHRHTEACYTNGEDKDPTCGYVDHKEFTLDFFYTERGESGSTCWMQFTLPSVSSKTPETTSQDYGHLKIQKKVNLVVDGKEYPVDESFEDGEGEVFKNNDFQFKLSLTGSDGSLADDFAYYKYDKNGKLLPNQGGVLTWDTIADGEYFTLKDGEYIRIQYLPAGSKYTIEETGGVPIESVEYYGTDMVKNDQTDAGEVIIKDKKDNLKTDGTVPQDKTSEIKYINKYFAYALPETGGSGPIIYTIAGVLVLLTGAGFMYRKKVRERRA